MKHNPQLRPEYTVREELPKVIDQKLMCPFCEIPHELSPVDVAKCGTLIRVTAIQTVVPKRTVRSKKLTCLKCKKGDGEMVVYGNGYIHLVDCMPEIKMLSAEPKYSNFAKFVHGLPAWMKKRIEKNTGIAKKVRDVDQDGQETGKVLGYFFYKP